MTDVAILEAFRELPELNRVQLLGQLWDELLEDGWTPPFSDARKTELDRRWRAFCDQPQS